MSRLWLEYFTKGEKSHHVLIQAILCFLLRYVLRDLQSCYGCVGYLCLVLWNAFKFAHNMLA